MGGGGLLFIWWDLGAFLRFQESILHGLTVSFTAQFVESDINGNIL